MRTKQALKNVIFSLLLQVVTAVSGLLLPRFFIELYGSAVNGLVTSISQFITYMTLVEAGIGAAGAVALYRPLADKDDLSVSRIVTAAKKFYIRSGMIFVALVAGLVLLYPYAVTEEINDSGFVRWMIVVLSVSGVVDYFFLGKYRVLLTADQRGYVISAAQILGVVVTLVVSIVLMEMNASALAVKSVTAVVYILRSLIVWAYAKKHYKNISFRAEPDYKSFGQRWAALLHQVVALIVNNLAVVLLTLCLTGDALAQVSVYGVYSMVAVSLQSLMQSITSSLGSGFGEVISKDEKDVLRASFSNFEFLFFVLIFIAYSCMAVLFHPFVSLYSMSFTDGVVYLRWELVVLFTAVGLVQCLRQPANTLILAAGHYKQTQWRAILEAAINLVVSLILVRPLGVAGVVIGMLVSYLYRTTDVILYSAKRFVPGTLKKTLKRIAVNVVAAAVLITGGVLLIPQVMTGWMTWLLCALAFGVVSCVVFGGVNLLLEPREGKAWVARIKGLLSRG